MLVSMVPVRVIGHHAIIMTATPNHAKVEDSIWWSDHGVVEHSEEEGDLQF